MSEKFLGPARPYRYKPRAPKAARSFRGSSAVEQSAVNRSAVGSNPTPGASLGRGQSGEPDEEALLDDPLGPRVHHRSLSALDPIRPFGSPAVLALLVGSLAGCATAPKPAPAPPAPRVASVPAPAPSEPPPVPRRKPPIPNAQAPAAEAAAAPPDPPVPAEVTHLAAVAPAPPVPEAPSDLVGMESSAIEHDLGPPESRRDVPPAVVWHYADDACGLDIWLYRELQSGALRALFIEVKGDDRTEQRRQYCIKQLAVDSAGGTRRGGADSNSPR